MKVIEAPQWLKERMEKLKQFPSPSLEEVNTQFRASEKYRVLEGKLTGGQAAVLTQACL